MTQVIEDQKLCTKCGETKPVADFYFYEGKYLNHCRLCRKAARRRHHERESAKGAHYAQRSRLIRGYGITPEEFDRIVSDQGGMCAIPGCGGTDLVIDHDHESGKFRGVICRSCNLGLGYVHDSVERLEGLVAYLKEA